MILIQFYDIIGWIKASGSKSRSSSSIPIEDPADEGSGSGVDPSGVENYPPDDEDFPGEGSVRGSEEGSGSGPGDDSRYDTEGSGGGGGGGGRGRGGGRVRRPGRGRNEGRGNRGGHSNKVPVPYDPVSRTPGHTLESQPPSAAAKESMSLSQALTVYLLPAIIMFFESIS